MGLSVDVLAAERSSKSSISMLMSMLLEDTRTFVNIKYFGGRMVVLLRWNGMVLGVSSEKSLRLRSWTKEHLKAIVSLRQKFPPGGGRKECQTKKYNFQFQVNFTNIQDINISTPLSEPG